MTPTPIDYEAIRTWLQVLHFLITAGVWFYVVLANRHRVTTKSISDLKEQVDGRLDNLTERLVAVETECKSFPDHDALGKVYDRINGVAEELAKVSGGLQGLQRSVDMLNEHHLRRGNN